MRTKSLSETNIPRRASVLLLMLGVWLLMPAPSLCQYWTSIEVDDPEREGTLGYTMEVIDNKLLVSWRGDNSIARYSGAVLVYDLTETGAVITDRIIGSDLEAYDQFGERFILKGNDLFVAESHNGRDVYHFRYEGGRFTEIQKLPLPDLAEHDYYPRSFAFEKDWAFISAVGTSTNVPSGQDSGVVFVFKRENGNWILHSRIDAPGFPESRTKFGAFIDVSETSLAISESGGTRLYELNNDAWEPQAQFTVRLDSQEVAVFLPQFIDDNTLHARRGNELFVFQNGTAGWVEIERRDYLPAAFDVSYHESVEIDDFLFLTKWEDEKSLFPFYRHVVSVFKRVGGPIEWEYVTQIYSPDPGEGDGFGYEVALTEDFIIIGAPWQDLDEREQGGPYLDEVGVVYLGLRDYVLPKETEIIEIPDANAFSMAYPNPARDRASIDYTVAETSRVSIAFYDALGRLVRQEVTTTKAPGFYSADFDLSAIPSGIYYYRIVIGHASATRPFTVIH